MGNTREPTGRTRHRTYKRWFGPPLLVLQREYRYRGTEHDANGSWREYDFKLWEDATTTGG